MKLRQLIDGLGVLDLLRVQHEALAEQSELLAATIREALSAPPGEAHVYPWRESGTLAFSIGSQAEGLAAAVGSSDAVASYQEYGTATIPPRPFLAPLAEAHAPRAAHAVGEHVVAALRSL